MTFRNNLTDLPVPMRTAVLHLLNETSDLCGNIEARVTYMTDEHC